MYKEDILMFLGVLGSMVLTVAVVVFFTIQLNKIACYKTAIALNTLKRVFTCTAITLLFLSGTKKSMSTGF